MIYSCDYIESRLIIGTFIVEQTYPTFSQSLADVDDATKILNDAENIKSDANNPNEMNVSDRWVDIVDIEVVYFTNQLEIVEGIIAEVKKDEKKVKKWKAKWCKNGESGAPIDGKD